MGKHIPIPVRPVKTKLGEVTVTEYKAECVKPGCRETRTMSTRNQATGAMAGHIMSAHGDSSYC
jgi:hypothetical protein